MRPDRKIKKYANGLIQVGIKLDQIESIGSSLNLIVDLIKQEPVFKAFFYTRHIPAEEKVSILGKTLNGTCNPVVAEFIGLLGEAKGYALFPQIAKAYQKIEKEALNQVDVLIETAESLPAGEIDRIVHMVEKLTGKHAQSSTRVDPELLGGIRLRVGNDYLDGTIATGLEKLKQKLLKN